MIVTLNNTNTETFLLTDIRSIKFEAEILNLYKNNGNVSTWNISDIANYRFEGVSGLGEMENNTGKLEVFPNPASNQTMITFSAAQSQTISIELLDLVGRKLRTIYSGNHIGQQSYSWQVDIPKGIYICRVAAESGIVTQSLIIQ
jgi:ribosomal protein S8